MKWTRAKVTHSDGLTDRTEKGIVSGPFGIAKYYGGRWSVIHRPTGKRLHSFRTQRDAKAFVARLVDFSPSLDFWKTLKDRTDEAARIFEKAMRNAKGKL